MHLPDPSLPPMFTGHAVKAPSTPVEFAVAGARNGQLGAADLVWSRNVNRASLALVLEPDVSLAVCGQMMPLAAAAVAETLGAIAPPRIAVEFSWPSTILINGGRAGTIELTAPHEATEAEPPNWLILAVELVLNANDQAGEPGERADETSLYEEGATEINRTEVIEALATRLLAWLHTWQHDGFRPIHDQYYFRIDREKLWTLQAADGAKHEGRILGFDETAAALVKSEAGAITAVPFTPFISRR